MSPTYGGGYLHSYENLVHLQSQPLCKSCLHRSELSVTVYRHCGFILHSVTKCILRVIPSRTFWEVGPLDSFIDFGKE